MDDDDDQETERIALAADKLHLVTRAEAIRVFDRAIGSGAAWASPLMRYRTTSQFQEDWKVEVGNWLECSERLGFVDRVLRNVVPQREADGERAAGDAVHRNVAQQLAAAMFTHYLVGIGWRFHAWEPTVGENRSSGAAADVDLQFVVPSGVVVDLQVKASGRLGLSENEVDPHIQQGVRNAAAQLPVPALRPAFIAISAQRRWWLSADIDVMESFVGSTGGYPDGTVLLLDEHRGEFSRWPHISGIVVLDYRRSLESYDYSCVVVQNPWANHAVDPAWFPHARILTHTDGRFSWIRGHPSSTTFPTGTRMFAGTMLDAFRLHGEEPER